MAILHKVAYGVTICIVSISINFFSVYNRHAYVKIVSRLAQHSMQAAVEEVQTLPDYSTKGEVRLLLPNMLYVQYIMFHTDQ